MKVTRSIDQLLHHVDKTRWYIATVSIAPDLLETATKLKKKKSLTGGSCVFSKHRKPQLAEVSNHSL